MREKEQTLRDACDEVRLNGLPKPHKDNNGFWVEAILLVRKRNLQESYVLARRDGRGAVSITRDFGSMSPIMAIIGIYPFTYLDSMGYDNCETNEEKKKFIRNLYRVSAPTKVIDRLRSGEDIDVIARDCLIERQLENRPEDVVRNAIEEREATAINVSDIEEMQDVGSLKVKRRGKSSKMSDSHATDYLFKES